MKTYRNIRYSLMVASLVAAGSLSAQAPFGLSLFKEFDALFGDFEAVHNPKLREHAEDDLKNQAELLLKKAQELTKASEALALAVIEKDDAKSVQAIGAFAEVKEHHAEIAHVLRGVGNNLDAIRRAKRAESIKRTPSFGLRSFFDEKKQLFVVEATLPGLEKDDLKISVKTTHEAGIEKQELRVTAQLPTTKDVDNQNFQHQASMRQAKNINGRREELVVDDKQVVVAVDLPRDASNDLFEVQKTMSFEANVLKLSFPIVKKERKKETELRFSSATKGDESLEGK